MIKQTKCVEYYFDSKKYKEAEILENIQQKEKGFEKKMSEINIVLNEYGIYVVKLKFSDNKFSLIKTKMTKNTNKNKKTYKGYETYNGNNQIYGRYKSTKTYQPI